MLHVQLAADREMVVVALQQKVDYRIGVVAHWMAVAELAHPAMDTAAAAVP